MKTRRLLLPTMLILTALLVACGGDSDASSPESTATSHASPTARATREAPEKTPTTESPAAAPTNPVVAPAASATPRARQPVNVAPTQPPPPPAPTNTPVPQPPVVQPQALTIVAKATKFSPSQLTAIAGATITVTLDNQDAGIAHDLIIYTPSGATAAQTPAFAGPAQQSATFTPGAAGNYFFKCSLHPVAMTGAISIQP